MFCVRKALDMLSIILGALSVNLQPRQLPLRRTAGSQRQLLH
jgi:hypothetical protein